MWHINAVSFRRANYVNESFTAIITTCYHDGLEHNHHAYCNSLPPINVFDTRQMKLTAFVMYLGRYVPR